MWLLLISGPGNAKTETVQALSGVGAICVSTIASEDARGRNTTSTSAPAAAFPWISVPDQPSARRFWRGCLGKVRYPSKKNGDGKVLRAIGDPLMTSYKC